MPKRVRFHELCGWSQTQNQEQQDHDKQHGNMRETTTTTSTNLNYFICTLGEAAIWNREHPHPFHTVNDLVDEQAKELRQRPAINFAGGCNGEDGRQVKSDFTYRELRNYSLASAARLRRRLQISSRAGAATVGLLCSSTPEFVMTWLGLMRLGMSVMLLAPQLEPNAIQHLCATCKITTIFADARNYNKATKLHDGILAINISNILRLHALKTTDVPSTSIPDAGSKSSDIAYLFHTSGTSSGLPKPVPQTHYAAVGVLPRLPGGEGHATFSTTPLYHGGIADCLRAWTSGATIHLFPGAQPITKANLHRAVDRANAYLHGACPVKYFASVPYILQMLVADADNNNNNNNNLAGPEQTPSGIGLLQKMDLVGVGGAALPPSVGDELVANGVRLLSRFGCAECGFLLTSHRDYASDREWSYLRANRALQPEYYAFEPQIRQDGGGSNSDDEGDYSGIGGEPALFELVVKPDWPHRGKTNRPDGSLATADLFEAHASIPDAWRYHSRADAQITLVSGKKFDPAPVEGDLLSSAAGRRSLADAMVFGTGREAPGLLLIPRWNGGGGGSFATTVSDEDVVRDVWPTIEEMNGGTQNHARISRSSVVVVRRSGAAAAVLPKSSKGTILRGRAEALFAAEIEEAYSSEWTAADERERREDGGLGRIPDGEVLDELVSIFDEVLGRRVSAAEDLFAQGVDSISCAQLRKRVAKVFFPPGASGVTLPLNVIYDQGTVDGLAQYILRCRVAGVAASAAVAGEDVDSEQQLMLDLVEKYQHGIQSPTGSFDHQKERSVVLTGATGFLGAHVLDLLLRDPSVSRIFCLVRARSPDDDATRRVSDSLASRGLSTPEGNSSRLVCLPSTLSEPNLGLAEAAYDQIASQATVFIHSAWPVNFSLKLRSFEGQLAGLRGLLALRDRTRRSAARFVFISSTAAVSASERGEHHPLPETPSAEPEDASPLGYSRSKWVAENICTSARVVGSFAASPVDANSASPSSSSSSSSASSSSALGGDKAEEEHEERWPIVIVRVGQLCGSQRTGAWNRTEAYPIMLSSTKITGGRLPDLGAGEALSWVPVDLAAQAVLDLSFAAAAATARAVPCERAAQQQDPAGTMARSRGMLHKTPVYHVANPHQEPTWSDLLSWIREEEGESSSGGGYLEEVVSPASWLRAVEEGLEDPDGKNSDHPARSLLHLWEKTFAQAQDGGDQQHMFDTARAARMSETMRTLAPLSREHVVRMWNWIQSNV